ncbi:MAG TPA: N-6 DNA methylase [Ktedonobacteraceae bacterium]
MVSRTKTPTFFSPSASEQIPVTQSAQRIITLLEQGRAKTGLRRSDFFTQTLLVWDATLQQADMDEFLNVACVGVEKAMHEIALAFEELFSQAMDNYYDILGATFMLAHLAWKDVGDEYTPWDLVLLIVRLTMSDFTPPQPDDPPITVYDPCCGSGAFLLGCLDYIDTYYPEVLDRGQVKLYGQELTHVGWLMCRINLHLHQLARYCRHPWTCAQSAEIQKGEHVDRQKSLASSELIQQQSLWVPADFTIDQGLRQQLLASYRPARLTRSKKVASDAQVPYGLGPLFAQARSLDDE